MEKYEVLLKLKELLDMEIITKEEFDYEKKKVLDGENYAKSSSVSNFKNSSDEGSVNEENVINSNEIEYVKPNVEKGLTIGMKVAIILIPIVGLVMYFTAVMEESKQKEELIGYTIGGFVLSFILGIILFS